MTDAEKLALAIEALRQVAACACFLDMVGDAPNAECNCITCTAKGALLAIGETWPETEAELKAAGYLRPDA